MKNTSYRGAGERIRKLRELHRYTREEFAEIADISPKFLYEIETGLKGFSADTLYRIARGLSVNCDYILSGSSNNKKEISDLLEIINLFDITQIKLLKTILETVYKLGIVKLN